MTQDADSDGDDSDPNVEFFNFLALKANDLEIPLDNPRLFEHCRAAYYCMYCAGFAVMAVFLSAEPSSRIWFVIDNLIQTLRGLPRSPLPDGDPLDALKAMSPLLELAIERCTRDPEIRRVLQRIDSNECSCLPPGDWTERTAHAAAVEFAKDVLRNMWLPVVGVAGMPSFNKDVPRFDESMIQHKHRRVIRRSLAKFQIVELMGLVRGINLEVARSLKGATSKRCTTILFFAADPSAVRPSDHLSLDKEVKAIEAEIRASVHRDQLDVRSAWAVQASDLSRELQFRAPEVVHFGCHGDFESLELEGTNGNPHAVTYAAVTRLFRTFKDVRLVFLNVCNTADLAKQLVDHVDCAIGMNGSISDDSAVMFAAAVYRALASGQSIRQSFDLGKTELALHDRDDVDLPVLEVKDGMRASDLFLTGTWE